MRYLVKIQVRAENRRAIWETCRNLLEEVLAEVDKKRGDSSDSWSGDDVEVEWQVRTPTERSE